MLYRPPTAEIERHALEVAAEYERKIGPFRAEIVPDATPAWYIVRTAPGQEDKAARFLEARAIGVFLPRFVEGRPDGAAQRADRPERPAGISRQGVRVRVGCAGALAPHHRVPRCERASCATAHERPIVVPDAQMNRIQILQYELAIARREAAKALPRRQTIASRYRRPATGTLTASGGADGVRGRWQQRTNIWRKRTSPTRGRKTTKKRGRQRRRNFSDPSAKLARPVAGPALLLFHRPLAARSRADLAYLK